MSKIKPPIVPESAPEVLALDELGDLLKVTSGKDFAARRDCAIIRLFIDTGIRRSELAELNVADVDLEARELLVLGKGRRPRVVPLGTKTAQAMHRYLRARARHKDTELPALWLGIKGRMANSGIQHLI